jgi:hypothetical protein
MSQYPEVDVARLLSEESIPLTILAREENVSPPTPWRWGTKGVYGILMETFLKGGRRYSTREAYQRFCEATTNAAAVGPVKSRTRNQQLAHNRQTNDAMDAAGI